MSNRPSGENEQEKHMLGIYRGLDLTDEMGFLCGKILAELGADVIKIEPPGGDPARNVGPFYEDIPDPEKSLYWFAFNTSKRGITLNIETEDGKEIFRKLVKTADFVIESFNPSYMDELCLGYSNLSRINPRIIMTSISSFGQKGPYKDYKASDIVAMAMGGLVYPTGDIDRPPVRIGFPQACLNAASQAAAGTLIALYSRELTGEGQQVDVSQQESLLATTLNAIPFWELEQRLLRRAGPFRVGLSKGARQRQTWRCKDGLMVFMLLGGAYGARTNSALTEWMDSEGMADDFLRRVNWSEVDISSLPIEFHDQVEERLSKFFLSHTKSELHEGALKRGIMLFPVNTVSDLLTNPQLRARHFWQEVEYPNLTTVITHPGAFVRCSETTCVIRHRAPLIGEHNEEVFHKELGISKQELTVLKQAGVI